MGTTSSLRSAHEVGESGGSVHLPQENTSQPGDVGGPPSMDASRIPITTERPRGDIGGDDRAGHPSGSGGSGGSGDRPGGYPAALALDPGGTDEVEASGDERRIPEAALPTGGSEREFGTEEMDDDDDFGDFEANLTAASEARSAEREMENDEDWEFAPVQSQGITVEEHNKSVQKLVENWLDSLGPTKPQEMASMAMEDDTLDWDSWLRGANIPPEAQDLIANGISGEKVPVVPFAKLGVKAEETTFGAKVRENFWKTLGQHLQLPSVKPEMSPPGSPTSPVEVKTKTVETEPAVTMVDADWGLLETVGSQSSSLRAPGSGSAGSAGPGPAPGPMDPDADVLTQALSSVGLAAPAPSHAAAYPVADPLEMAPAPKKKKGMTHKVKNFLAGLPDLKHLYSKSVVT